MEPPYFISVSIYFYFVTMQLITINLSWCKIGLIEVEMGFKSQRNELWTWCCLEMEGDGVVLRTSLSSSPTSWEETRVVEDLLTTYASCLIISHLNANSIEPFLPKSISVCTRGHVVWFFDEPVQKLTNHLFSECMSCFLPCYDASFRLTRPSVMAWQPLTHYHKSLTLSICMIII